MLSDRDLHALAAMHCEILPQSLVSRLGQDYARSFYRYIDKSKTEFALLEREGSELVGGCIVSEQPQSLQKRLLLKTPLIFNVPRAIHRLPLASIAGGLVSGDKSSKQPPGPEILLIFTTERVRGLGLGKQLIERCEERLRAAGFERYHVKTADSPDNRAIAFYVREGFTKANVLIKNGKRLLLLSKPL